MAGAGGVARAGGELGRGWSTVELVPRRLLGERQGREPPQPAELAPRGVGAILDTALDVLTARLPMCAGVATLLWIPAQALGRIGMRSQGPLEALGVLAGMAGQFVVQSLAVALVTVVVYGHLQGQRVGSWQSARLALGRAPALLVTTIVSGVTVFAGTMCCLVPGIVLSWLWMVAPAALVLEKVGPLQALARSARLVRGGFWRWAGVMLAQFALVLPVSGVAAVLADPAARAWLEPRTGLGTLAFDVLDVALSSVLMGLGTAFGAVVLTVFYIDCRVRSEGFDLVMRFERLRRRAAPRSASGGSA
jgi:hypothetical protein